MAARRALDLVSPPVQHFPPAGEVRPRSLADLAAGLLSAPRRGVTRCACAAYHDALRPADRDSLLGLLSAEVSANALASALKSPEFLATYGGESPAPVPHASTWRRHVTGECVCPPGTPGAGVTPRPRP